MFLQEKGNTVIDVPPAGNTRSKIAIIGDFTGGFDMSSRRPFSGPAGTILESCLHNAGLIRGEVYVTNLIKCRSDRKELYYREGGGGKKSGFTDKGMEYVRLLQAELTEVEANILIAMGPASFLALCSLGHLSMYRGYVFPSTLCPGRKVIPTFHPAQAMRGMHTYRYMIAADFQKAKIESQYPELRRPERDLVLHYGSVGDALDWLYFYETEAIVGFDIEVINYEVSCISFSSSPDRACVIPIAGRWTLDEECQIWLAIQRVLGNPNSVKVIQNSMFDVPFLLTRNGIVVRGEIHDTMIAHSIMYPELQKGLGFLGSVYCGSQEYWKNTVRFTNIKDAS